MHKRRAMFLICFGLLAIGLVAGDGEPHPDHTDIIKNGGQCNLIALNSIHILQLVIAFQFLAKPERQ